ncbi:MAG: transcription antiterminator [Pantoea sp.]|uniref:BglG family transcription antiterminator n=1 Tax=Pantoea sp. TaxID=69393 RepID=UPI0039E6BF1B
MTVLNKRQIELVNLLALENSWLPMTQVAQQLNISISTIRRDVEVINLYYLGNNKVISKPGLGLKLDVSSTLSVPHDTNDDAMLGILKSKRLISMTTDLLSDSPDPLSISALAEKYFISRSSIVEDLKKIEIWIEKFSLAIRKNHSGTFISGTDYNIRMALKEIITHSVLSNYQMTDSRIDRFSRVQLITEFGQENVANCMNLIALIEEELQGSISEPYYTNLFSHLLVTLRRNLHPGRNMAEQTVFIRYDNREWRIAENAILWLENEYQTRFPAIEVNYIYQYIISSGMHPVTVAETENNPHDCTAMEYAGLLVNRLSASLDIDFSRDSGLKKALASHIKPMLNRLVYGIVIHNPLLEEIRNEFNQVFTAVKQTAFAIHQEQHLALPSDDEIAWLTIYIQNALEKTKAKKRVILVCSSGIGTSQLLSSRINRAFPEWEIIDIVPGARLKQTLQSQHCDLIISTIRLDDIELPVAYVSALFSRNDIARVVECLGTDITRKEKCDAR